MEHEQTTLYYRGGGSDKVYRASLESVADGFTVNVAYGRRGSALSAATKTPAPLDHAAAKKIYDRLVRQKTAKGYAPGEKGAPHRHSGNEGRGDGGILCQLPHPVEGEEQVAALLRDPAFCLQEKFDGRRLLIRKTEKGIEGINRRGLATAPPELVCRMVEKQIGPDCVLDGECLGNAYVVFDVLSFGGEDLRPRPYGYRLALLGSLIAATGPCEILRRVTTAAERPTKEELLQQLRRRDGEGAVFKRLNAPHTPGRTAAADQFKHKFRETASFVAGPVNGGRRSVALRLHREGKLVPAGNVTIPANRPVPPNGAVVEVRYLYAFPQSGSVYQPVYLGERDDVPAADCTVAQLKYRAETADAVSA